MSYCWSYLRSVFAVVFFLAGLHTPMQAQQVWPGDANNNGIVNSADLLWVGLAYDTEGPERPNASTLWLGQQLGMPWAQNFPGGLNYAYADCDGDGEINDDDLEDAIRPNFRLTHGTIQPDGFINAPPGSAAPELDLIPSTLNVIPGETVTIDVVLGSAEMPVQDFYGIAFTLSYTQDLIDNNGEAIVFDADDDWIAPEPDEPHEDLFYRNATLGECEVASVRTNQQPITGFGPIGTFSIIIEDIIVGLTVDTFILQIDSIRLIDHNNNAVAVRPDTALIIVSNPMAAHTAEQNTSPVSLYPNPSSPSTSTWIKTAKGVFPRTVTDALGRTLEVHIEKYGVNKWRIHWPTQTPPGVYALVSESPSGPIINPIILH